MSLQMQSVLGEDLDLDDDHDDDVRHDDRRNDRPGVGEQQQQQQTVTPDQKAAEPPAPQPPSELPSAPHTLGDSLVDEDVETQGYPTESQPLPMDDDDYHYAVPDSQPSQPGAGEDAAPAVYAPATAVRYCDNSSQQGQHQHRDAQDLVWSDVADTSYASRTEAATQQCKPTIRTRVVDWMASHAPGSWVRRLPSPKI
jgi:hypothetical protein